LSGLRDVRILDLQKTKITDAGLKHVLALNGLKSLRVGGTEVTKDGLEELKSKFRI